MAASATFALKAGVWFRRGRLIMVSPDSQATACPPSGRNSTYRPVQISGASSGEGGTGGRPAGDLRRHEEGRHEEEGADRQLKEQRLGLSPQGLPDRRQHARDRPELWPISWTSR